jgi:hypothetical protein
MDRYQTRHHVCTSAAEAHRLAGIDGTPPEQIPIVRNVEPLHVAGAWALWSDGVFSTSSGCALHRGGSVSADAERLISRVWISDSGEVECGLLRLADIDAVEASTPVAIGPPRGPSPPEAVQRLKVRWKDGSRGELYTLSARSFGGYWFGVYNTLESLLAAAGAFRAALAKASPEQPEPPPVP